MNRDLIVNTTPNGTEIALLEDKALVELHREAANKNFIVGDIFLGKVKKIVPGLNAAFIDIGFGKDAFLHYTDLGAQVNSLKKCIVQVNSTQALPSNLNNFPIEPDILKTGKINDVLQKKEVI